MAIQNASDLLVYLNFPSAIQQVTRIKIKTGGAISSTGSLLIKNSTKQDGTLVPSITLSSQNSTWTGVIIHNQIKNALENANGYVQSNQVIEDGYTTYDYTGNLTTPTFVDELSIVAGTAVLSSDAIIVEVITTGAPVGNTPAAFSTNASLSISRELRDCTNKDSSSFSKYEPGLLTYEITTDALQDFTSTLDFVEFERFLQVGDEVTVKFSQKLGSGDQQQYKGPARVTSLSMDAGFEENATYSVTFTGTGVLVSALE